MKAIDILSKSSANLEGSIVLSREEVAQIRAEITDLEAHIAHQSASHDRLVRAVFEQEVELQTMGARNPGIPYPSDEGDK